MAVFSPSSSFVSIAFASMLFTTQISIFFSSILTPVPGARFGEDRQDPKPKAPWSSHWGRYRLGTAPETAPPPPGTQLGCSRGLVPTEEVARDTHLYSMGFTPLIQEPQPSLESSRQSVSLREPHTHWICEGIGSRLQILGHLHFCTDQLGKTVCLEISYNSQTVRFVTENLTTTSLM